jgi:hypothetical protein
VRAWSSSNSEVSNDAAEPSQQTESHHLALERLFAYLYGFVPCTLIAFLREPIAFLERQQWNSPFKQGSKEETLGLHLVMSLSEVRALLYSEGQLDQLTRIPAFASVACDPAFCLFEYFGARIGSNSTRLGQIRCLFVYCALRGSSRGWQASYTEASFLGSVQSASPIEDRVYAQPHQIAHISIHFPRSPIQLPATGRVRFGYRQLHA